jgi:serine/threonine protein kinase
MIGKTLLHFEITDKLGEGGMGTVYRALDKTLDRQVAIKVLPDEFTSDPERLARFEREAKVLAALDHPNIASIFSFEEAPHGDSSRGEQATRFLVMQLAEGETLSEIIRRGPIAQNKALELAHQIALALETAHEKGIVHRDLKPANVKITPEGNAVVLDFGLAKALSEEGEDSGITPMGSASLSPTLTAQMTKAGVLLGTAAYMSPEQARGQLIDKRADVWAFGCVLLEMLTSQQVFAGDTVTDVLAALVTREPDWEALPADTHLAVRRVLRRCLEKDPNRRLRDIGDARLEIEEALSGELETTGGGTLPDPPTTNSTLWKVSTVLLALAAGILGFLAIPSQPIPREVIRAQIAAPPGNSFDTLLPLNRPSFLLMARESPSAPGTRTGQNVSGFAS